MTETPNLPGYYCWVKFDSTEDPNKPPYVRHVVPFPPPATTERVEAKSASSPYFILGTVLPISVACRMSDQSFPSAKAAMAWIKDTASSTFRSGANAYVLVGFNAKGGAPEVME